MLNIIIAVVAVVLLTIGIVWVIDKFLPKKAKPFLIIALWVLIAFLGYKTFMSVYGEIEFNKLKEKRYVKVIEKLIDVRNAQVAHKVVTGKFTDNFDNLVKFVDTAQYTITQRRYTTVIDEELTRRYGGVETTRTYVVIDTLGYVSVKDSLFKTSDRYKTMMNVPFAPEGTKFNLQAGLLEGIPVFEASVEKKKILHDQDPYLIKKEEQVVSVDGVNGPTLKVGSMDEVNTNGNWPKNYSNEQ